MSIFGYVPGIVLNDTIVTGLNITGNGVSIIGNSEVNVPGLTITDGTLSISEPQQLFFTGSGQTLTEVTSTPTIVQFNSAEGTGNLSCTLNSTPSIGNILVAFGNQGDGLGNGNFNAPFTSVPGSSVRALFGYAVVDETLAASKLVQMQSNNIGAVIILVEIAGFKTVVLGDFEIAALSIVGPIASYQPVSNFEGQLLLTGFTYNSDSGTNVTTFSNPTPIGSELVSQIFFNASNQGASICLTSYTCDGTSITPTITYNSVTGSEYGNGMSVLLTGTSQSAQVSIPGASS